MALFNKSICPKITDDVAIFLTFLSDFEGMEGRCFDRSHGVPSRRGEGCTRCDVSQAGMAMRDRQAFCGGCENGENGDWGCIGRLTAYEGVVCVFE